MKQIRKIIHKAQSIPTLEGAGVRLRRAFGFHDTALTDPFLLLDDFRGDDPSDYLAGFPWHPHRGIETITYILEGSVEHGDSLSNKGVIGSGDVQWMTAGSGIIHQDMPKPGEKGRMGGFQLWANLPRSEKMTDPKYRGILASEIPVVSSGGAEVRVICGIFDGVEGPVTDVTIAPEYLDITLKPDTQFTRNYPDGQKILAYIFEGNGVFGDDRKAHDGTILIFDDHGDCVVRAGKTGVRFLLISGKPLKEPVAWYGPIVMNTEEELKIAFEEYENGTFIRNR
jgi:quercetin 2,3-dioxygenase